MRFTTRHLLPAFMACLAGDAAATVIEFSIDPARTYLHTTLTPSPRYDAIPIDLSSLGISDGDTVRLDPIGDFSFVNGQPQSGTEMIGVLSGSDTLLGPTFFHRVPDAIDFGADVLTPPTLVGSEETDIDEDFLLFSGLTFVLPAGATHLFISTIDNFFVDNADADGDFALVIENLSAPPPPPPMPPPAPPTPPQPPSGPSPIPEPGTWLLLAGGLAVIGSMRRRTGT